MAHWHQRYTDLGVRTDRDRGSSSPASQVAGVWACPGVECRSEIFQIGPAERSAWPLGVGNGTHQTIFPLPAAPPVLSYGRNYGLSFPGRIFAGKGYDEGGGKGGGHATLLSKLVEMRHCGEIGKRDGECVIGQNTIRKLARGFWAHSWDGIASLVAR
jgi:hypothetical protein